MALLPEEVVAQLTPDRNHDVLSPVQLLAVLLRLRGRAPISGWLQGILHLVAMRLVDSGNSPSTHWRELRKSIPSKLWKELRSHCPATPSDSDQTSEGYREACITPADAVTLKMFLAKQKLKLSCSPSLSEADIHDAVKRLESRTAVAFEAVNADAMLHICEDIIALMAPPRKKATHDNTEVTMSEPAKDSLRCANQTRLRALLLQLLNALDLQDEGTNKLLFVPLQRLRFLLQGREFKSLASQQQWDALYRLLEVKGDAVWGYDQTGHKRRMTDNKAKASLKKLMIEAMMRCNGHATASQIISRIMSDKDLWGHIEHSANRRKSRRAHQSSSLQEAWQSNIQTNLSRYCQKSGRKDNGQTIWMLATTSE